MLARESDVISRLRQAAGVFADTSAEFQQLAGELLLRVETGKLKDTEGKDIMPAGHEISFEELMAGVLAVQGILSAATEEQKAAITLMRV